MANASNYAAGRSFNSRDAVEDREVVVMVTPTEGSDTSTVVSAGTVTKTSSGYVMTVENEGGGTTQYIFDSTGQPVSTNAQENNYSLMMAETTVDPVSSTVSDSGTVYTRGTTVEGKTVYTPSEEENAIVIDSLNAKDQFAIQILKSIFDKTKDPSALSKTQVAYYCEMAYNWAGYMMKESSKSRAIIKDENPSGSIQTEEVTYLEGNTEKLLNNIAAALDKTNAEITLTNTEGGTTTTTTRVAERITVPEMNKLMEEYVKHTPTGTEPSSKTTVGLDDLITAIKGIGSSGGGQTTVDFTDLITAINTTHTQNIGGSGLGRDENHPLYISGGGFPNKDSLAASIPANSISDFLTFNGLGAVGYSSKAAVQGAILGYLAAYEDLASLCSAIVSNLSVSGLFSRLQNSVDGRIKQFASDLKNANSGITIPTGWSL